MLLQQLLRLLRVLPVNRGPALLIGLKEMVAAAAAGEAVTGEVGERAGGVGGGAAGASTTAAVRQRGEAAAVVMGACWQGLEECCRAVMKRQPPFAQNKVRGWQVVLGLPSCMLT